MKKTSNEFMIANGYGSKTQVLLHCPESEQTLITIVHMWTALLIITES